MGLPEKYKSRVSSIFFPFLMFRNICRRTSPLVFAIFLFFVAIFFIILDAPSQFTEETIVTISKGTSLQSISQQFEEDDIVRSAFLLRFFIVISGKQQNVVAGDYFFEKARNVISIARVITTGEFNLEPVKITIPEGMSVIDMAAIFSERLSRFNPRHFLELAQKEEGYLFPDTYHFFPNVSEEVLVDTLRRTFDEKIKPFEFLIKDSKRSLEEIIIMASLIEREARTTESRRIISGILWKRIDIGMPLQVDVTFDYINGKDTFDLTLEDLEIDSLYNTYRYAGLPPGPIGNPSLDSIEATLLPIETEYLYFLADKKGKVHYSATFEGHKKNKQIYLN